MRRCTLLGGQADGEIVNWIGPRLRLPVRRPFDYAKMDDGTLPPVRVDVEEYEAHRDCDGRWWYVVRP